MTSIDLSDKTQLNYFNVNQSPNLTSVNIKNGNNANLTGFFTFNSPLLTCITVDDPAAMSAAWPSPSI